MGKAPLNFKGLFHIDDADGGHWSIGSAGGQGVELILADLGVVARFDRRSGASQDDGRSFQMSPHDRYVSRMVAGDLLALLIGAVVLFIDDDDPEIGHRREDGRSGADRDPDFPFAQQFPGMAPFTEASPMMDDGDFLRKAGAESFDRLRGE